MFFAHYTVAAAILKHSETATADNAKNKKNGSVDPVKCDAVDDALNLLPAKAHQKKGENNTLFSLHARPMESNAMPLEFNTMPLEFNARTLEYFCYIEMVTQLNTLFSRFC